MLAVIVVVVGTYLYCTCDSEKQHLLSRPVIVGCGLADNLLKYYLSTQRKKRERRELPLTAV